MDFESISQSKFRTLCRLIHPKNIRSLTLGSNEQRIGQINVFISFVNRQRLTQLHSLTLIDIDESELN
ncbi:hypothetical protein I4U23_025288 [Adineta vaga]|nr:hypothetical protein I4U23_025288 [Adineta vaga]